MVNNFSIDQIGLYINLANTSSFIILGKLPTLNLPIESHTSFGQLFLLDEDLMSNYHGCKGEAINQTPHYMTDRYYLQNCKAITFRKITNHAKYK